MATTLRAFLAQVETRQQESGCTDDERDRLHASRALELEAFQTRDAAEAALWPAVEQVAYEYEQVFEEEVRAIRMATQYPIEDGGGFWFELRTEDGTEVGSGRALVRPVSFTVR